MGLLVSACIHIGDSQVAARQLSSLPLTRLRASEPRPERWKPAMSLAGRIVRIVTSANPDSRRIGSGVTGFRQCTMRLDASFCCDFLAGPCAGLDQRQPGSEIRDFCMGQRPQTPHHDTRLNTRSCALRSHLLRGYKQYTTLEHMVCRMVQEHRQSLGSWFLPVKV